MAGGGRGWSAQLWVDLTAAGLDARAAGVEAAVAHDQIADVEQRGTPSSGRVAYSAITR